jgi:hypothetical protein
MSKVACFGFLSILLVISVAAQSGSSSQPTVWATKPDAAAFEKIVNDRLAEGQKSIDQIVAVKAPERSRTRWCLMTRRYGRSTSGIIWPT